MRELHLLRPPLLFRVPLVGWFLFVGGAALLACSTPVRAQPEYEKAVTSANRTGTGTLRIDVLVDSARLGSSEVEIAEIVFQPGARSSRHRHGSTEILYVLQGDLDHVVNGETRRLSPGMVGIVRAGDTVEHRLASIGPVRVLAVWTPGGEAGRIMRAMGAGVPTTIASIGDDMLEIRALRDGWSEAYNAGQIAPLRDMYTADAVRMPYDAPAQLGRASVLAGYERSFAARTHTPRIVLTAAQVEIRGDIAVERGDYDEVLTPKMQGRTLREIGKYVSLLRRGADGKWRFEWSIFNRDAGVRPQGRSRAQRAGEALRDFMSP